MGVKVENAVKFFFFSFDPMTVFWLEHGHPLFKLSDSNF